jgi:hypothetical protein
MDIDVEKKKKLYQIMGSKLEAGKSYKGNVSLKILTYNVESAIRLAKEADPKLEISQINLKETIDIIDPEIILDMFQNKEGGQ